VGRPGSRVLGPRNGSHGRRSGVGAASTRPARGCSVGTSVGGRLEDGEKIGVKLEGFSVDWHGAPAESGRGQGWIGRGAPGLVAGINEQVFKA
jgi:hypothetical protein